MSTAVFRPIPIVRNKQLSNEAVVEPETHGCCKKIALHAKLAAWRTIRTLVAADNGCHVSLLEPPSAFPRTALVPEAFSAKVSILAE